MGRRNDHTHQQIREMAITAGKKILEEDGLENFSARKLGRTIGYTVGTLYNVFGNLDELMVAINSVIIDEYAAALEESLVGIAPGRESIKQIAYVYADVAAQNFNRWRALYTFSLKAPDATLPDWHLHKIERFFELLEGHIRLLMEDPVRARISARTIWAGVHGIVDLGLTRKLEIVGVVTVKTLLDDFLETYFKGIE